MSDHALVLSTASNADEAAKIARELVERRLAACVNVLPGVRSTYRWKGSVHVDDECLLVVKTRRDRFEAVREAIRAMHSYEQPEIILVEIAEGDAAYLRWIDESLL